MTEAKAVQAGEKACPSCAQNLKAQAKICRFCGHQFSPGEFFRQQELDRKKYRRAGLGCALLSTIICGVVTCSVHEANRPLTVEEVAEKKSNKEKSAREDAELRARGSAVAIVKERLNNPGSFELVGAEATPTRTSDGKPGWLVGVTYRATNVLGGVISQDALVIIDETGNIPLKVVDVSRGLRSGRR